MLLGGGDVEDSAAVQVALDGRHVDVIGQFVRSVNLAGHAAVSIRAGLKKMKDLFQKIFKKKRDTCDFFRSKRFPTLFYKLFPIRRH